MAVGQGSIAVYCGRSVIPAGGAVVLKSRPEGGTRTEISLPLKDLLINKEGLEDQTTVL